MRNILALIILINLFSRCSEDSKIEGFDISPNFDSIKKYEEIQLKAKIINSDQTIDSSFVPNWKSTDTSIIRIDSNGKLIGIREGSASITCNYNDFTKQISIKIVSNPLFNNKWVFTSFQDLKTQNKLIYPDSLKRKAVLFFSYGHFLSSDTIDYTLIGFGGLCNGAWGRCVIKEKNLTFPYGIADTRILCINYEFWEDLIFSALRNAKEYSTENGQLTIISSKEHKLTFDKYLK